MMYECEDGCMQSDIQTIVNGIVDDSLTDEEVESWLREVFVNGLSEEGTVKLTHAMTHSGVVLRWPDEWAHLVVDKHSTGGVGDKVSIPLAPAVAACGAKVPMISGRGLGHTGGTLDKLEAMGGYRVALTIAELQEQVGRIGCAIVGQTAEVAPADKRMYAIRDVTGLIASVPLVTGSILSKKAAAGLSALVMDIKVGRAAFMKTEDEALELAQSMASCGRGLGMRTSATLTEMNSPIGYAIGNALEVLESVETLRGNGPADLEELVCVQGGIMLADAGLAENREDGAMMVYDSLHDGSALSKFIEMSQAQGVEPALFESEHSLLSGLGLLDTALLTTEIRAENQGWVSSIDALTLAEVCRDLGAGRKEVGDSLDMQVGMLLEVGVGSPLEIGDSWVSILHRGELSEEMLSRVRESVIISDSEVAPSSRILRIL